MREVGSTPFGTAATRERQQADLAVCHRLMKEIKIARREVHPIDRKCRRDVWVGTTGIALPMPIISLSFATPGRWSVFGSSCRNFPARFFLCSLAEESHSNHRQRASQTSTPNKTAWQVGLLPATREKFVFPITPRTFALSLSSREMLVGNRKISIFGRLGQPAVLPCYSLFSRVL